MLSNVVIGTGSERNKRMRVVSRAASKAEPEGGGVSSCYIPWCIMLRRVVVHIGSATKKLN